MLRLVPPTDCLQAREAVSARLDGELTELDAVRLDAHLRGCAACRTFAGDAEAAARLLRTADLEQPPAWELPVPPRRRAAGLVGAAAAVAVVAAAAAPSFLLGRTLGHGGARTATGTAATVPASLPAFEPSIVAMLNVQPGQSGRLIHL